MGAGLCSQGHGQQHSEQEIELVFLGTGKQFPGERKQEHCMASKTVLDFSFDELSKHKNGAK